MDMAEIGANIRSCRTEKDMTMEELGKAIGKSQSAVADYEKGRVDIPASSLIKIAEALEVHPAKLFGMQTADEQFKPDTTLRIFSAEDRRAIAGILVMNGYTTRHIKVATFYAIGTLQQLKDLQEYMKEHNIQFGKAGK